MVGLMVGAETTFWHYLANLVAVSLGHVVGAVFLTALALYFIYGPHPGPWALGFLVSARDGAERPLCLCAPCRSDEGTCT